MITRENYEIYFIDYLEGILSSEEVTMVNNFLSLNPDLKEELELIQSDSIQLKPVEASVDFTFLKKHTKITEENEDEFFIGSIENELIPEQEALLTQYVKDNPNKVEKQNRYAKTILTQQTLIYPHKEDLKQSRKIGAYYWVSGAVAASLAILIYFGIPKEPVYMQPATYAQKANMQKIEWVPQLDLEGMFDELIPQPYQPNPFYSIYPDNYFSNPPIQDRGYNDLLAKVKSKSIQSENLNSEIISYKEQPISSSLISNNTRKVYSVREFLVEKTQDFASKKAGVEIKSSQDFLTFATNKLKKSKIGRQINVEGKTEDNQTVRVYRIGRFFKITRKIKN